MVRLASTVYLGQRDPRGLPHTPTTAVPLGSHGCGNIRAGTPGAIAGFLNLIADVGTVLVADEKAAVRELREAWGPDPTQLAPGPADTRDGPASLPFSKPAPPSRIARPCLPA